MGVPRQWRGRAGLAAVIAASATVAASGSTGAAPAPPPVPSSSVVVPDAGPAPDTGRWQGQLVAVEPGGRALEVDVGIEWWPTLSVSRRRVRVSVGQGTRFVPSSVTPASLVPGDDVELSVVGLPGGGWRAIEITRLVVD